MKVLIGWGVQDTGTVEASLSGLIYAGSDPGRESLRYFVRLVPDFRPGSSTEVVGHPPGHAGAEWHGRGHGIARWSRRSIRTTLRDRSLLWARFIGPR